MARAAASPSLPEQQFAFPEFTIRARIFWRDFVKCDRDRITGAAATWFVVKTAAAAAGVSVTRITRSSLDAFRPQCVAANVKPRGTSEAEMFALMCRGRASQDLREWAARRGRGSRWQSQRLIGPACS